MSSGSARSLQAERLRHFYHVWAGGQYADAVAEHGAALRQAGLLVIPEVGIVGTVPQVRAARMVLDEHLPGWQLVAQAKTGFEQVTLAALHEAAMAEPAGSEILYCHTKGALSYSRHSTIWRREMTDACVRGWRTCVRALRGGGFDVAGGLWMKDRQVFAGNFWWARAGYLASLDVPADYSRHAAEDWIGTGLPRVADVAPGLPCSRPVRVRMLQPVSGGHLPPPGSVITVSEMEAQELCHVFPDRDPPALAERVSA